MFPVPLKRGWAIENMISLEKQRKKSEDGLYKRKTRIEEARTSLEEI